MAHARFGQVGGGVRCGGVVAAIGPSGQGGVVAAAPVARAHPRSLVGATILQLVPALRDDSAGHAAVDIALTLLQAGARAIVAGDGEPLVGKLRAFGGEWLPMINDNINPLRIWTNAREIARLIAQERVDIVLAQSAGGAWSALAATDKQPVFLVTSFPDRLPAHSYFGNLIRSSLARGDRVIAPSSYVSRAMIERYKLTTDRITMIPRAVEPGGGEQRPHRRHPPPLGRAAAHAHRAGAGPHRALERAGERARRRVDCSLPPAIATSSSCSRARTAASRALRAHCSNLAHMHGIDTLCRFVGHCADVPAAHGTADVVWWRRRSGSPAAPRRRRNPWAAAGGKHGGRIAGESLVPARACAKTCAPAGWYGRAMSESLRAPSARACARRDHL